MDGQTQLSPTDHDKLIEATVGIRDIKESIQTIKDGVTAQLADHDQRLKKLETLVDQTNPLEKLKEFEVLKKELAEQRISTKYDRRNWAFIGSILAAIFVSLINALILHFLGKI